MHEQKIVRRVFCTVTVRGIHSPLALALDIRSPPLLLISVVIQLARSSSVSTLTEEPVSVKGAICKSSLSEIRDKTARAELLVGGVAAELWWAAMAALILANAVAPGSSTANFVSTTFQQRLHTSLPCGKAHCNTRGSWKGVRAAKKGDEKKKPSFSLGDQLLDYIEGAARVMVSLLAPPLPLR